MVSQAIPFWCCSIPSQSFRLHFSLSPKSSPAVLRLLLQVTVMANASFHVDLRNFLYRGNPVPMFLYDGDSLRILEANDAAIAKYGYSRREFRAMTLRNLRPGGSAPAPETPHEASSRTHSTKAGKLFAVDVQVVPFQREPRKLFLMSVVAASADSGAQPTPVPSEELHRSLVEKCPFGIYRLNLTTARFEHANPIALSVLGYSLEEFCAINVLDLYVESADRDRLLSQLRTSASVRNFDTRFRKKDGDIVRVSLSAGLYTDGETGGQYIQGYVLDTTRQRELEDQLTHAHRMEAVGRLAGGVAHDFNNIAQSISLSCELALQSPLAPDVESNLLDVMQQTARAAEITRQLLAFSCLQVLQPRVLRVNDCVQKALPMLTRAVGADISIELKLDDDTGHVFVDPDQLALVLIQLADNARTAMPHGGALRISTSGSPGNCDPLKGVVFGPCTVLTVSDTGIGMDEATLQRIFEPFFSTKETALASGLGLSTVHGIIAQSEGRIECTSSPGKGTTFQIYLPIATAQSTAVGKFASNNEPFRVLLAEDDPIVSKSLSNAMRRAGFSVNAVCNGEEALAAFG
jgi:two-component system, cell cycle sensor histidine kinase and response regulator CckA